VRQVMGTASKTFEGSSRVELVYLGGESSAGKSFRISTPFSLVNQSIEPVDPEK